MPMDQLLNMLACGARRHAIQALVRECQEQKLAGRYLVNPARSEIKESILFDLPDGCAVRAFHVVRIDFKLWLSVDASVIGEQQVAIGLLGISLLCIFVND